MVVEVVPIVVPAMLLPSFADGAEVDGRFLRRPSQLLPLLPPPPEMAETEGSAFSGAPPPFSAVGTAADCWQLTGKDEDPGLA